MKKLLLATAACFLPAAGAMAIDVELFGQVNKGAMIYDDGRDTDTIIVDNNLSRTKVGFAGEQQLDNGLIASVLLSADLTNNNSAAQTQSGAGAALGTPTSSNNSFTESETRVGLAGDFGAIFVGQQTTAIDDAFYHDLGGAADVMGPGFAAFGGGLQFRNSATGTAVNFGGSNATVNRLAFGWNGDLEEQDSIRYNSPKVNNFDASISISQGADIDTNIRYNNTHNALEVDASLGYAFENSGASGADTPDATLNFSASVAHENGLAATFAYFKQELDRKTAGNEEPSGYYLKGAYSWDNFSLAVDYANVEDAVAATVTDHELTSYGVAGQYDMGSGVSLSALARVYDADITGTATDEINVYAVNLRVKF